MLEVTNLTVDYDRVRAVDDVTFSMANGEFLGVVGESGCGKSTLLFAIARLLSDPARISSGEVTFNGANLVTISDKALNAVRWRDMSLVMQSAMNALNPVTSIGRQFADALRAHGITDKREISEKSVNGLKLVGVDPVHLKSYPHQLSGGMRQRAMIAMALLFTPELVIMDEPTSALDVVAQRSLMTKIKQLQDSHGFAVLFVTHDMSLVSHYSDRLLVMYAGQVSELGATKDIFASPRHPYTQGLLNAFPSMHGPKTALKGIPGAPPDLGDPPPGCRFQPRCPKAFTDCLTTKPDLVQTGDTQVRCLLEVTTHA
jgi:peptide/nickel transport system ATP-binding protein